MSAARDLGLPTIVRAYCARGGGLVPKLYDFCMLPACVYHNLQASKLISYAVSYLQAIQKLLLEAESYGK